MKKILLLLTLLFLTGCSVQNINNISIDEALSVGLEEETNMVNSYNEGYSYYIPKGFRIFENNLNNQTLLSNGHNYYLNVDIISYYNKTTPYHATNENSFYYKSFSNNGKDGYLEIIQNNDYFFVEMMYNYAIIEVVVKSDEINYAIINTLNVLSSIKYNDTIIENEIGESVLTQKETIYKLEEPKIKQEDKNFLDWVEEYDNYVEPDNGIKDEDKITD